MAIINDNSGMFMPVAPAYGGGGGFGDFGGGWWIILLLLCGWGGMGGYGMGGFGGGLGIDFPWILNGQNGINANTNNGFDHAATQAALGDLRTAVGAGFGDVQLGLAGIGRQICETGNGITGAVRDGFYTAEIAANGRQMASMQQNFDFQTTVQQGFRDVIENNTRTGQLVLDKLCQLELDGVKNQLASAQRDNAALRTIIDGIYNRLASCPVDTTPVYGRQAIFQCPVNVNGNNGGCGCGVA